MLQDREHAHELNLPKLNMDIQTGKQKKSVVGMYSFQRGYKPFHTAATIEAEEMRIKATNKEQHLPE